MTLDQLTVFSILAVVMILFVWNHWRYDVVAGIALLTSVYAGIVPMDHAFEGFSHPAVITVACVLVISQALQSCGVVELFLRYLAYARGSITTQIAANCGVTAFLSAFMNNIGALALMLPITLRDAQKSKRPASKLLIPLSFASLLGGLVTLVGTPPNIIIATFRANNVGEPFSMFDFTPVGIVVALAGLLYLVTIGWRLLPGRPGGSDQDSSEQFHIARYISEVRVPPDSQLIGTSVGALELMCEGEVAVMLILRKDRRRMAPSAMELLQPGDVLILEGHSESLQPLFENPGMLDAGAEVIDPDWLKSPDVRVIEAVVMPNSAIEGLSMRSIGMHQRFGVNLLAVAREGHAARTRLKHIKYKTGDVLLLQGETQALEQLCQTLGCLGIKNRGLEINPRRGVLLIPGTFAMGIFVAAMGWVPVEIAFTTVVGILVLMKMVSLRAAYRSIEWPIIVLLGFLIPIGEALQTTGATELIAQGILGVSDGLPVWSLLILVMTVSMLLSDLVHNTPTAVLMAPIALSLATGLGVSADPFLMAVAVGAASPYLTPIGHQSNTLVMGPGGYSFGDYWRVGLLLDIVIVSVAVPMIMLVWM
ncbi:SLC13 family permease [Granulosicoccus antarcticus]|uniref:Putative transporter n=1 Tax=Granulosicoccus antarcticus IMCC3135 TaxID=1192854 RepID=A0A2Z2NLQ3_9GAMM|nr:SLC13 family permease [Granulosicoccus antarcticus]ASJ70901.1 putative transporter [Granulosicoccus antarcticus IMCC3135]